MTANLKVGESFKIDLTQITATDAGESYDYSDSDMSFVIKLTKDGTEITSTETTSTAMTWDELEAGSYVVTVTATDKAGNVSYAVSNNFKVEAKSSNKVTSTTVWGTILVILALVVLAGLIFFFVRPTKGKIKVNNKKIEKTEDSNEKAE